LIIPKEVEALTSEWLSQALGCEVRNSRVVGANNGTTGRAVLEMEYASPASAKDASGAALPARLFVKLPPVDEMQRAFVTSVGMGLREATFYTQLSHELPMRVPRNYYSASDDAGEHYIMLLEHLEDTGCTFRNASKHYSMDYLKLVLGEFAALHAHYWQSPRFSNDLSWLQPPQQHDIAKHLVGNALQQFGDSMPAVFTDLCELYLADADAIHELWQLGPITLVHGDAHDGNLFMDGNRPGFLDWAVMSRAPAMRDVGYFLAGTLKREDRPAQRELLSFYHNQLQSHGVDCLSVDELWQQYQWQAVYVWLGATVTLAMGEAWQPVNYLKSSLEKLHEGLQGLDSVNAIRAAL